MEKLNKEYVESLLQHDVAKGLYRHNRESFTNPELFELEMKYIFEKNWVYLAHESQITELNDYFTTHIGRQSIFISRNKEGELNAFINACSHRGAQLCRYKKGNKSTYTCPFHGWTFNNSGKLLKVKDGKGAGYPEQFNTEGSHDLKKIAKFESYKGFLFGSLNPDSSSLEDYLGDTKKIIDQMVDQAEFGLEVVRGASTYTYDANWKMQMENGADGYHVSSVHWNYVATMGNRKEDGVQAVDPNGWSKSVGGVYGFENGHMLLWTKMLNPEVRPLYSQLNRLNATLGEEKTNFIINETRNLALYPNVYLMDQFSTQIRVVRPISVDKTEVTIYCFAPKNEAAEDRALRIRQYEDFFNVTGMGTPDDLEEFRSCQESYLSNEMPWNDVSRGAEHWVYGPDEHATAMGINPKLSGIRTEDEGLFLMQHQYWAETLKKALDSEELINLENNL
ncbi:Rieske 2Fe-2S domain-containing protein [Flavobacterium granuli]|uniref:Benzoate 1,2-dioxygenase alpha subunit n=1 Tax=Flavobacterium granuli TaxID=280093 RepID=A0A1M5S0S7_9FLAO|nr:Rieske 2Fe-2S domain-containing protein [Flavobacterium granuli]PRZ21170.1 benzoate 1,2-dioxygenase alpha subunit [Flavobacterium granuli]SHH32090.1 benzoate 1,2-dioxygenase, alpha subunit [Flavobacterium granuli]